MFQTANLLKKSVFITMCGYYLTAQYNLHTPNMNWRA